MTNHASILAWKIQWTEDDGLQSFLRGTESDATERLSMPRSHTRVRSLRQTEQISLIES